MPGISDRPSVSDRVSVVVAGAGYTAIGDHLGQVLPEAQIALVASHSLRERERFATVLIPVMSRIDATVMDRVADLRLIQQWGAGLEGVDIDAATARGIAVANVATAGTGNAESVAEWCVMAAIAAGRKLPQLEQVIRDGSRWGGPVGRALWGKTAGVVGLGGVGQAVVQRLMPFGMDLIAVTRRPDPRAITRLGLAWLGGLADLPLLLSRSDFLFLCLPLNEQTRKIIDAHALALLPEQACVINAGRGGLVDHEALTDALAGGRLSGAGLDVFDQEPLDPRSPLLSRADIVATPHIAGVTDAAYQGVAIRVADNIRRLLAGDTLHDCVNCPDMSS
ncbi:MAG: lactate dehydrogenase [Actinomycetota bacterium]|nr:lactate dehydrogenase [Actinomycetota bacterium]